MTEPMTDDVLLCAGRRIQELEKEIGRLREDNEQLRETVEFGDMVGGAWQRDVRELDKLREENAKLRTVVEAARQPALPLAAYADAVKSALRELDEEKS